MPAKPLPLRLLTALTSVVCQPGEDIYFALGYLSRSTARSYMSQLKRRGLAYTYVNKDTTEVWPHKRGMQVVEQSIQENHERPC